MENVLIDLKDHCFYHIGGRTRAYFVKNIDDVASVYSQNISVAGLGSKILFGDIDRVAIMRLKEIRFSGNRVYAQAGVSLPHLSHLCRLHGLSGLEWACGIPGSVGGAVKMNAGAFGGCIKDCIEDVTVFDGKVRTVAKENLSMGYRTGAKDCIVIGCTFNCFYDDKDKIFEKMKFFAAARRSRQPQGYSCGSVFVSAEKPAGWYIDNAALKGLRAGGAVISSKHANFFLNDGNATAADVRRLIRIAKEKVYYKFGVELKEEIIYLGEFSE